MNEIDPDGDAPTGNPFSWSKSITQIMRSFHIGLKRGPWDAGTGDHNLKIRDVVEEVKAQNPLDEHIGGQGSGQREYRVPTPNGQKSFRSMDASFRDPDGNIYHVQVGKTVGGKPHPREQRALDDVNAEGKEVHFREYTKGEYSSGPSAAEGADAAIGSEVMEGMEGSVAVGAPEVAVVIGLGFGVYDIIHDRTAGLLWY